METLSPRLRPGVRGAFFLRAWRIEWSGRRRQPGRKPQRRVDGVRGAAGLQPTVEVVAPICNATAELEKRRGAALTSHFGETGYREPKVACRLWSRHHA